jgi:hypothetical protein
MVEAKNAGTTVKFERDALGRVVKEFQDEHWVETEYGPTGLRVKMKSSLGAEQEIQRNEMGDVMGVRAGQFNASFERDILGLETKRAFALDKPGAPDAAWSKWERDAFGRPTKQHRQGRGQPETTRFSRDRRQMSRWPVATAATGTRSTPRRAGKPAVGEAPSAKDRIRKAHARRGG